MITLVASVSAESTSNTTAAIDTTGANLLVLCLGWYAGGGTLTGPSDSYANTWIPLTQRGPGHFSTHRIWYAKAATVGPGHTFTASGTGIFATKVIYAFGGADPIAPYVAESGAAVSTFNTSLASGVLTPLVDDCVVVTGYSCAASSGNTGEFVTPTMAQIAVGNDTTRRVVTGYLVQTKAAAVNPTWAWTGSAGVAVSSALFRPYKAPVDVGEYLSVTDAVTTSGLPIPTRQVHYWSTGLTPAATGYYVSAIWPAGVDYTTQRIHTQVPWMVKGVFDNLSVNLSGQNGPGYGKDWTWTLQVNGVDTPLFAKVTATARTAITRDVRVEVNEGDLINLKLVGTGTPPTFSISSGSIRFTAHTLGQSGYGGGHGNNLSNSATPVYASLCWPRWGTVTIGSIVSVEGAFTKWGISLTVAPGPGPRQFTIIKNGVPQDGTGGTPDTRITLTGATTDGTATFNLPVSPGDSVQARVVSSGATGNTQVRMGVQFTAANPTEAMFQMSPASSMFGAATYYASLGTTGWTTDESGSLLPAYYDMQGGWIWKNLLAYPLIDVQTPGTLTVRKNGVSVPIAGSVPSGVVGVVQVSTGMIGVVDADNITVQYIHAGSPTINMAVACVQAYDDTLMLVGSTEAVAVTEAVQVQAIPLYRAVADSLLAITEFTRLVPLSTLPIFLTVSETVTVVEFTPTPILRYILVFLTLAETVTVADVAAVFNRDVETGSLQIVDRVAISTPFIVAQDDEPYWTPMWGAFDHWDDWYDRIATVVTVAGRIGNLRVSIGAPGFGRKWTFWVTKNGDRTPLEVVIADIATTGRNDGLEVHVAPGDTVALGVSQEGYPQGNTDCRFIFSFYSDIPGESMYGSSGDDTFDYGGETTPALRQNNPLGWAITDELGWNEPYPAVITTYGHLTRLVVKLAGNFLGYANLFEARLVKNGVLQDGSGDTIDTRMYFSGPSIGGQIYTQTRDFLLAVKPGDWVMLQVFITGANMGVVWPSHAMKFVAARPGESLAGHVPWNTASVSAGGNATSTTNLINSSGWGTSGAVVYGLPWMVRRLYVWAMSGRAAGVTFTLNRAGSATLTATAIATTPGTHRVSDGEVAYLATDTASVTAVSLASPEPGTRYVIGYTQFTGDRPNTAWADDAVAVTEAVLVFWDRILLEVGDSVSIVDNDWDTNAPLAALDGPVLDQVRRDLVTVLDVPILTADPVGVVVDETVLVSDGLLTYTPRALQPFDTVSVIDVVILAPSGLLVRSTDTVTVSDLLRTRTPLLAVNLSELVAVTEGPMNLSAAGIGIAPTPPPGSTLQDYWVVGIV